MTNVNYVTFKLPGREKTFTGTSISSCYRSFLQDYSEALPELLKVVVSYSYQSATGIKSLLNIFGNQKILEMRLVLLKDKLRVYLMKLFTTSIEKRLIKKTLTSIMVEKYPVDHKVVVKLFNPGGAGTYILQNMIKIMI